MPLAHQLSLRMRLASLRVTQGGPLVARRMESTAPPRSSSATSMESYRRLSRPFAKVFLAAMFTYQICYFGWEKMRTDEIMGEKTREVESLEARIKEYHEKGVLPDEHGRVESKSWFSGWFR